MKKRKIYSKLAQWWQRLHRKMQDTRSRTKARYEEWHRRQKQYEEYAPAEPQQAERITMLTVVRILLAEFGEKEYWRTLWHLVWRPGYAIADYLNGKRRQFLRPFQLLIGTTLLLGLAVFIVPAERAPRDTLEQRFEQQLQHDENLSRQSPPEAVDFVRKTLHTFDAYREWSDEHMAAGLLTRSVWVIFFTWLLFRKSPREEWPRQSSETARKDDPTYNFAEILTAQIFIIAQLQMVNVVWILVTGWFVPTLDFHPYAFPNALATMIVFIDYQQLFGRKWYSTLWRTLLCVIW